MTVILGMLMKIYFYFYFRVVLILHTNNKLIFREKGERHVDMIMIGSMPTACCVTHTNLLFPFLLLLD